MATVQRALEDERREARAAKKPQDARHVKGPSGPASSYLSRSLTHGIWSEMQRRFKPPAAAGGGAGDRRALDRGSRGRGGEE